MKTEHKKKQIERFIREASRHESSVNLLREKTASNASIGGVFGHFTITIETEHIKIDDSKHEFKVIPQQATIHSKQNKQISKISTRKCRGIAKIRI